MTKNGNFNIRSFHHKLHGSSSIVLPWKGIWKVKALRCVSFFVWIVVWDRILTSDNLQRRGFDFINWCTMCHCCREIVDHLLLHCKKAHRLWSFVFRTFGISWVLSRLVANFIFGWWNWLGKHSFNILNLVFIEFDVVYLEGTQPADFENLDPMTSCLPFLLVPFLIGLGLADSHLVHLSLCFLVLFFFLISFFSLFLLFSLFCNLYALCFCASLHRVAF